MSPSRFDFDLVRRWRALGPDERTFAVAAFVGASAVSASLGVLGFTGTIRWVSRIPKLRGSRFEGVTHARAGTIVERAFQEQPFARAGCLPQAILQFSLLRLAGRDVTLRVGVRRGASRSASPLDAHAWVDEPATPGGLPYEVLYEVPRR